MDNQKAYIICMDKGVSLGNRVAPCWTLLDIITSDDWCAQTLPFYRTTYPDKKVGFPYLSPECVKIKKLMMLILSGEII